MSGLLFRLRPIGLALRAASRSWYTLRASLIWQWPVPRHKLTIILDRMHEVPIEDFIDLHTFQPREIRIVIEEYLYQAIKRGFREIGRASCRGKSVDLGGRRIIKKKKNEGRWEGNDMMRCELVSS